MRDRVSFSLDIPDKLATRDTLTKAEFDTIMQNGLVQTKIIKTILPRHAKISADSLKERESSGQMDGGKEE